MVEKIDNFIEEVKKYPCIYNTGMDIDNRHYARAEAWRCIAEHFGVDNVETLKSKWKNLKDTYVRYVKASKVPPRAKRLRFLDPFLKMGTRRKTEFLKSEKCVEAISIDEIQYENDNDANDDANNDQEDDDDDGDDDDDHTFEPNRSQPRASRKIKKEKETYQVFLEDSANTSDAHKDLSQSGDEITYLFLSYADTFRRFSRRRQALMKVELAKLFSQAELEELDQSGDGLIG